MQMLLNDNIKYLVRKYFSLGSEGYTDFVRLTEKNISELADEFCFLNNEKELRKFIKIPKEMLEYIDEGFMVLKTLSSFCNEYNISFEDYYENKKNIDKQDVKLFKLINNFYTDVYFNEAPHCGINPEYEIDFGMFEAISDRSKRLKDFVECFRKYYKPSERENFKKHLSSRSISFGKNIINEITTKIFEKIGNFKIKSNSDLYFVISKNPDDYFLSSYEKGWTSCLNPESTSGLWSCLPFIMADKGRCILYITDMSPKEYMNIKSYTMFKRSWGIIGRVEGITKIYSQIFYPSKTFINNDFFQQLGIFDKIENIKENFTSKYALDLFYNSYNIYDYLYQDNTFFIHGRDSRMYLKFGNHNHNILKYDEDLGLQVLKIKWIEEGHTLSELIEKDKELGDFADSHFCKRCHSYGNTFVIKQQERYLSICSKCFKDAILSGEIKCSLCDSDLTDISDIFKTMDGVICRNCFNKKNKRTHSSDEERSNSFMSSLSEDIVSAIKLSPNTRFKSIQVRSFREGEREQEREREQEGEHHHEDDDDDYIYDEEMEDDE
jgi:hypothetical protein